MLIFYISYFNFSIDNILQLIYTLLVRIISVGWKEDTIIMANPTKWDYDRDYYDYDPDQNTISHYNVEEGTTEAYDADSGEPISLD